MTSLPDKYLRASSVFSPKIRRPLIYARDTALPMILSRPSFSTAGNFPSTSPSISPSKISCVAATLYIRVSPSKVKTGAELVTMAFFKVLSCRSRKNSSGCPGVSEVSILNGAYDMCEISNTTGVSGASGNTNPPSSSVVAYRVSVWEKIMAMAPIIGEWLMLSAT